MVLNPLQYYQLLRSKIQPSIDIQRLGSTQAQLRNSTTFGPSSFSSTDWKKLRKASVDTIKNQLGNMNR